VEVQIITVLRERLCLLLELVEVISRNAYANYLSFLLSILLSPYAPLHEPSSTKVNLPHQPTSLRLLWIKLILRRSKLTNSKCR